MRKSQIKAAWEMMMNDATSSSEEESDVINYVRNRRKRSSMCCSDSSVSDEVNDVSSKRRCSDFSNVSSYLASSHGYLVSPVPTQRAFRVRTADIGRTLFSSKWSLQDGARKRRVTSAAIRKRSQLKLVVCASSRKLTITVLGVRSLPPSCTSRDQPSFVYLKLSLSPDHENRIRHKTIPQLVKSSSVTLHDTFSFNICKRDSSKRLLISAWCKDDAYDRATFIGCMSFGVKKIIASQEVVQGWYYLLSESLGRKKHLSVKIIPDSHQSRDLSVDQLKVRTLSRTNRCEVKPENRRSLKNYSESSDSSLASLPYPMNQARNLKHDNKNNRTSLKRRRDSSDSDEARVHKRHETSTYHQNTSCSDGENKLLSFCKLSIGQAVGKNSRDVVPMGTKLQSRTPTGRRHVRRRSYSSTDLLLFRMSYYGNESRDESGSDSEYLQEECDKENIRQNTSRTSKPTMKNRRIEDEVPLQEVSVQRRETKSAKILCQSSVMRSGARAEVASPEKSEDKFVTESCLLQHRVSTVARRRKINHCQTPYRSNGVRDVNKLHPENIILGIAEKEISSKKQNSDHEDRGYHSAMTSSTHTSSSGSSDGDTSGAEERDARSSLSSAIYPNHKQMITARKVEQQGVCTRASRSNVTSQTASKVNLKERKVENDVTDTSEEKSRPSSLYSFKSWLQRRGGEKSLSTGWLLKYKSAESDTTRGLKRTSSLRKSGTKTCDSCGFASQTLRDVLKKKVGIAAFRAFLQNEYSEENVDFWLECENYKQTRANKRHKMATKIIERYLTSESTKEVNIDAKARNTINSDLAETNANIFDEAQSLIFKLMEKDSFRRFQISEYRKCKCRSFLRDIN